jgi:hypothetical protein
MSTQEADRRFARNLFSASDDDDQGLDDEQEQRSDGADDGLDDQRRFAANLFAPDDDNNLLAGLTGGRTVGRTTPPRRDPVAKNEFNFS